MDESKLDADADANADANVDANVDAGGALSIARDVVRHEMAALRSVEKHLGPAFARAVEMILERPETRVAASGIGKAGLIAQKAVATLASTGTPAFFLHPADAMHGDLGMAAPGDVALLMSNSGESEEIIQLIPFLRRRGLKIAAVTATARSTLGVQADAALELGEIAEACPFGFAPTASTTAMLALADALAMALMRTRGFTAGDYGSLHPAGQIGRRSFTVREVMRPLPAVALAQPGDTLRTALERMTAARSGAALMVDGNRRLLGIFTDGDLRRHLLEDSGLLDRPLRDFCRGKPLVADVGEPAAAAMERMRQARVGELPVLENGQVAGLVDLKSLNP